MEKSAPGQSGNKLYNFAVKATDQSHKKLYRNIILVLLVLEFLATGLKATHEEKIIYEKYHSGLEVDTPVQFHAVSTEVPLYTQTEVQYTMKIRKRASTTYNVTTYYAYLIVTDENGNQAVVVLSEGFNDLIDTDPFLTPQAMQDEAISDLSAEAGDLRDEINGKDGKTFYGVISSNELNQQQVITSNDKKLQKILSLDTLSIYHDEVPETVTVEDSSNVFLRILILIALAAVVVFYLVMRAIIEREQEKVREREWKEKIQRLTQKNPPVEEEAKKANTATNDPKQLAQEDKQRKAAEKTAQKAPTETAENTPEGLSVLRSLPAAWVVLGTGLQKQWPAIDIQGFFHVFTDEGAATAFAQPNGFAVEKMTGAALCDHLKEWQRYGITHIRLHQGSETREFLEKELGFGNNFNSDLQEVMIRYLQTKALNMDGVAETAKIFWMLLCKMIPERLFLVPFCFEGEDTNAPVEDNTLRLFPSAAKLITKQRAEGKTLLFDGYPFADKADGRPLHFRTLRSVTTGKEVLPVYTDFHEMLPIWQGRAHFALATFDDFKDNYQPASGVIINPISQALMLEPKDIEEIKKS